MHQAVSINAQGGTGADDILRVERLRLRYGAVEVLHSVELTICRGEVVVLIGASGSGKTSLLRCINLLSQPWSGRILIDGDPIFQRDPDGVDQLKLRTAQLNRIRAKTGMVFQQFNLFPHMTALQNVMGAPMLVAKVTRGEAESRARDLLRQVGLKDHADKRPSQLSGGQQQRVAIARALAMQPKVMLFDEPTSALDPELVGEVLRTMVNLARKGMTMAVVTHELGFAFEIADRVLFLDDGNIVADGPPQEVLLRPKHPRLQSFVGRFHESADMLRPFLANS